MRKFNCLIFILIALSAASVFAQRNNHKNQKPKFSSLYTNLEKDCKVVPGPADAIECKPVGAYRIRAGYGAVTENIWVETVDREISLQLSPSKDGNLTQSAGMIEWRLANGKPFAVIARFAFYDAAKVGEAMGGDSSFFQDNFKTAEVLIVKGLKGYDRIDFEVNAKQPNANLKLREMADKAYLKGK